MIFRPQFIVYNDLRRVDVFIRYNIKNPNPKLKTICDAS